MSTKRRFFLCSLLVSICVNDSIAINCYQCQGTDPTNPFQCNEWLSDDINLVPETCDYVHDAKYCVKHLGRFEASCIKCYQCSSSNTIDCSDGMIHLTEMEPQNCDHVFEAEYCIKSTSLDGGIGAKRFCSSLDLGNYCNYVKQPGDILTYRTCVFTCTGDGCNPGRTNTASISVIIVTMLLTLTSFMMLVIR